jgi:hypothetical protein
MQASMQISETARNYLMQTDRHISSKHPLRNSEEQAFVQAIDPWTVPSSNKFFISASFPCSNKVSHAEKLPKIYYIANVLSMNCFDCFGPVSAVSDMFRKCFVQERSGRLNMPSKVVTVSAVSEMFRLFRSEIRPRSIPVGMECMCRSLWA